MEAADSLTTLLTSHALVFARDLSEHGISAKQIERALASGEIVRLRKGLYCRGDVEAHGYLEFAIASKVTGGVIWGPTAGLFHGLTDDVESPGLTILVPRAYATSRDEKAAPLKVSRPRNPKFLTVGTQEIADGGLRFKITNPERTVVDLVRTGVRQHAIEAVRSYMVEHQAAGKLMGMAREFGAEADIEPLVEIAMALLERMPAPRL